MTVLVSFHSKSRETFEKFVGSVVHAAEATRKKQECFFTCESVAEEIEFWGNLT